MASFISNVSIAKRPSHSKEIWGLHRERKYVKRVLATLAALTSLSIHAAELNAENGISVLYINGQQAESKLGVNEIGEGFNQVVIRMDKTIGRGGSEEVFTSKPFVIDLQVSGSEILIEHPSARSLQEAERAFKGDDPKWKVTQDGSALPYEQEVLEGKSGLFPFLNMQELVTEHNKKRGIYFENGDLVDKPEIAIAATAGKTDSTSKSAPINNVEQLKAWYLKSSAEEHKTFRRWIIEQD